MTASGARRTDASGTDERPEPSTRPAPAGSFNPFRFLSLARLPRLGLPGGIAAALVLFALAALIPAGPAQAQNPAFPTIEVRVGERGVPFLIAYKTRQYPASVGLGLAVYDDSSTALPATSLKRTQTFTIRNQGQQPLSLTGTPRVSITGSSAHNFRVVTQPAATVAANGGTTTFTVEFKPSRRGYHGAKLSIPNNGRVPEPRGTGSWINADPFVFNLHGTGLEPITLSVAAVHKDGGLEVGWSESQEVIQIPGDHRRLGNYRVFHRQSGSSGGWTRSAQVREHSYRITEGIAANVQYEVRVEAYAFGGRVPIAQGTATSMPATANANRKPIYPGLPSEFFVEWDHRFRYVLPNPVDPDGDTITSETFVNEDGDVLVPPAYNSTTRLFSFRQYSADSYFGDNSDFSEYKNRSRSSRVNGGVYHLQVDDGTGVVIRSFRVWWIVPLRFSGNPAPKDLHLEPGDKISTSLPGAFRGETLPESQITRLLTRSNGASVPSCGRGWAESDWICFNPHDGGLNITTENGLAQTTKFIYQLTDNNPIEDKSPSTIKAEFTVHIGDGTTPGEARVETALLLSPPVFGETLNVDGPAQSATVGEAFSYTAPEATDPNEGDTITYTAALSGGGALPAWLAFNATTQTFSGTPTANDAPATHTVVMTATDDGFVPLSGTWTFALSVSAVGLATEEPAVTGDSAPEPENGETGGDGDQTDDGVTGQAAPPAATPPTAEAGANMTGKRGGDVTLSGSGTKHAEGSQDALTYSWRIKSASHAELLAGTSWLKNKSSATATYSVPRRKNMTDRRAIDNGRTVEFELTVTDGDGETDTDTVTMTIQGSTWKVVSLSVADASAKEDGGSLAFTVSLSEASRDAVTVAYATSNGTALAGSDYTAASGTLTFQPGDTSKTVTVTLLDDAHDESTETFTLTLSNPTPVNSTTIADATATGSITNSDPLQRDWLARFGRAAASDAIAAVTARLETPRGTPSHFTVGGHRLPLWASGEAGASGFTAGSAGWPAWSDSAAWSGDPAWPDGPAAGTSRPMDTRELLTGTSFRAVVGGDAGPLLTGWGQGASVSRFSGTVPGLSLSGESATGSMGMDYEAGRLLAGFALTHSLGEGTADGAGRSYAMGSTVTAALPYLRFAVSDRISAWGLAGTGTGRLTLDLADGALAGAAQERYRADLSLTLAAVGVRGDLLTPAEAGGFALALKADAFWVRTESDAVAAPGTGNLAAAQADTSRLRAVLDGSRTYLLAGGGALTPSVTFGLRHDGGDAETGSGMELGAGVGYADASRGLDMVLRVHGLAAHAEDDYDEWGVSGSLRLAPGVAGRGLVMSLTPSYGAEPAGSERLWMLPDASGLAADDYSAPTRRLDAELGYGLPVHGALFTGTPVVGLGLSDAAREVRLGWRLTPAGVAVGDVSLGIEAARRESAVDLETEHRIGASLSARW